MKGRNPSGGEGASFELELNNTTTEEHTPYRSCFCLMINETHDPNLKSWVESANNPNTDFPIQNLPFCTFRRKGTQEFVRIGIAIGDSIFDVQQAYRRMLYEVAYEGIPFLANFDTSLQKVVA